MTPFFHHVIQYAQTKAFPGLEKPSQPSPSVPGKLQQKFFLMAAMGNVPDNPRNVMPIGSWHFHAFFLKSPFSWKNGNISQKTGPFSRYCFSISTSCLGPTPASTASLPVQPASCQLPAASAALPVVENLVIQPIVEFNGLVFGTGLVIEHLRTGRVYKFVFTTLYDNKRQRNLACFCGDSLHGG